MPQISARTSADDQRPVICDDTGAMYVVSDALTLGYSDEASAWYPARIDGITFSLVTIDAPHHEIHDGHAFVASYTETGKGDGSFTRVAIQTPAAAASAYCHLLFTTASEAAAYTRLYRAPATITGIASVPVFCRNQQSGNVSTVVLSSISTFTGGTEIVERYSGSSGLLFSNTGAIRSTNEWVLSAGTTYIVEMESDAAGNILNILLDWYETERGEG